MTNNDTNSEVLSLHEGNMMPSPTPIIMRKTISKFDPPEIDIFYINILSYLGLIE